MIVKVTQFLRPNGRQRDEQAEVSDDCVEGYKLIQEAGCRLTAEELMNEMISCTIEHEEGDFDISVTRNGPEVIAGIEKMLRKFSREKFDLWLKKLNEDDVSEDKEEEEAF